MPARRMSPATARGTLTPPTFAQPEQYVTDEVADDAAVERVAAGVDVAFVADQQPAARVAPLPPSPATEPRLIGVQRWRRYRSLWCAASNRRH
jgi:hypothetical protein